MYNPPGEGGKCYSNYAAAAALQCFGDLHVTSTLLRCNIYDLVGWTSLYIHLQSFSQSKFPEYLGSLLSVQSFQYLRPTRLQVHLNVPQVW